MSPVPLFLAGVGMRRKNLYLFEVDVYLCGFNLSKPALGVAQAWSKANKAGTASTGLADELVDSKASSGLASGSTSIHITLNMVRHVLTNQIVEAFNDAFVGLEASEVAIFKEALRLAVGPTGILDKENIGFSWLAGGGMAITRNGEVKAVVQSAVVEKRLLEVYVNPKLAVSKELLDSISANVENVTA